MSGNENERIQEIQKAWQSDRSQKQISVWERLGCMSHVACQLIACSSNPLDSKREKSRTKSPPTWTPVTNARQKQVCNLKPVIVPQLDGLITDSYGSFWNRHEQKTNLLLCVARNEHWILVVKILGARCKWRTDGFQGGEYCGSDVDRSCSQSYLMVVLEVTNAFRPALIAFVG
jgi:hypothetical protein